jgi:hypothetical protein
VNALGLLRYAYISQLVILFDVELLLYSPPACVNQTKALVTSEGYQLVNTAIRLNRIAKKLEGQGSTGKYVGVGSITARETWMMIYWPVDSE